MEAVEEGKEEGQEGKREQVGVEEGKEAVQFYKDR